jgi:Integrase core domain
MIEAWRKHYNDVRPHSSLGYLTPAEFVAQGHPATIRQATGRGNVPKVQQIHRRP